MQYLRKVVYFFLIIYNWLVILALVILDATKIDIRPQQKGKDFSFLQTIVLFSIASFFSTLFYIVFRDDLPRLLRDFSVAWIPSL